MFTTIWLLTLVYALVLVLLPFVGTVAASFSTGDPTLILRAAMTPGLDTCWTN